MTNPKDFNELKTLVNSIEARLAHLETSPFDLRKRQITNLPAAKLPSDAVPLGQLQDLLSQIKPQLKQSSFSFTPTPGTLQVSLAYNAANQTIVASTVVPLTFDTNVLDTGIHSTSVQPTRFIINVDGIYLCFGQVEWAANATTSRRSLFLEVNGGLTAPIFEDNTLPTSLLNTNNHVLGLVSLVGGDYITFGAAHDASVSINSIGSAQLGCVVRLGS